MAYIVNEFIKLKLEVKVDEIVPKIGGLNIIGWNCENGVTVDEPKEDSGIGKGKDVDEKEKIRRCRCWILRLKHWRFR